MKQTYQHGQRYTRLCEYCKQRDATLHFGDLLSLTHGGYMNCCELCCAQMQLDYAKERANAIPELEKILAKAKEKYGE